jgi:hypothetical protein
METKKCNVCGIEKHKTQDFPKNGKFHKAICKVCHCEKQKKRYEGKKEDISEQKKKFYEANKEEILDKAKLYRSENSEKLNLQKKEYYKENRDTILQKTKTKNYKEKRNSYLRIKRQTDKQFSMICAYRARLNEILQKQKRNSYLQYLNCDRETLLDWLEFQFTDEFEWKTYGKEWVIDHVIPIDFFDLQNSGHTYMCFSWFNLRPCTKAVNLSKSNKIMLDVVEEHQKTLDKFIEFNKTSKDVRYQTRIEIFEWLRNNLRYGKNPSVLGNPQPSS